MGYYTQFELKVQKLNEDGEYDELYNIEVNALGREIEEDVDMSFCGIFNRGGEGVKWCTYDTDMIKFSKKYPGYVFSLYGVGEDGLSDTWVHYFNNGFHSKHKVQYSFPEFDYEAIRGMKSY